MRLAKATLDILLFQSLPACVAVPLHGLSEDLGLPPVICHPGLALANYAPIDPSKYVQLSAVQTNVWLEEKLFLSVYFNKLVIYTTAWARPTHSSTWAGCRLKCK